MTCAFPGCDKPAYRSKLCTGHRSQKQRGQELRPLVHRPPVEGDCRFPDCGRPARSRGLCAGHYNQLIRGQDLRPLASTGPRGLTCEYDGCGKPHYSRGLCAGHHSQRRRGQELRPIRVTEKKAGRPKRQPRGVCSFPGCGRPHEAHGLCLAHYKQRQRGVELRPITPRVPRKDAPPPPKVIDEGPKWIPGTLWPELERAESKRPSTLSRDVDPATLLYTSVLIPDETKAACRAVLEAWDALDLADMLGVAA